MNFVDYLRIRDPDIKIPKHKSEKVKINILKKWSYETRKSLIRKEVYDRFPKNPGLYSYIFSYFPASFQTKAGSKMKKGIVDELQQNQQTKRINDLIGNQDIEILILYFLVRTKKRRDIDNYTKNLIDALHIGGLFYDDKQVKFHASMINYIDTNEKQYSRALEKAIVRVDFFKETNVVPKAFNEIFCGGLKC